MQSASEFRKILPVLKKVCNSFGDKMNTEFIQVMFLLMTEQPWFQMIETKDGFTQGGRSPTKKEFNKIFSMAAFSLGAYSKNPHQLATFLGLRGKDIVYFNSSATIGKPACFLALDHKSKEIVASIRGTVSDIEVLRDLIIQPSPLEGGLVHSGMRDQANEVIVLLKPHIDNLLIQYPDYRVVFTGHSLGAGAASIAALVLQTSYSSICAYCFACPSCMSPNLLPRLENNVISVMNMHDLIPRMNSSSMHDVKTGFEGINWKELLNKYIMERMGNDHQMHELWQLSERMFSTIRSNRQKESNSVEQEKPVSSVFAMVKKQSPQSILKNKQRAMQALSSNPSAKHHMYRKHTPGESKAQSRKNRNQEKLLMRVPEFSRKHTSSDEPNSTHGSSRNQPNHTLSFGDFQRDYIAVNHSITSLVHTTKAYSHFHDSQKKAIQTYKESVQLLTNMYLDNITQQLDLDLDLKLNSFKSVKLVSLEKDCLDAITTGNESTSHCIDYIIKQTSLLSEHLNQQLVELNEKLQQHVTHLQQQLESEKKLVLPVIPNEPQSVEGSGVKRLYDSIRLLFSEGFKKNEDWFPYPQLYPPGKLYHIQGNPMNGLMKDDELLTEVAMRLDTGEGAGIIKEKEKREKAMLVEVTKEEFDHYSLHESLFEDHRMGNYVWGLCKVFDNHYSKMQSFVC